MEWSWEHIFDRLRGYVCLIDAATYRVLYANSALKKVLGRDIVGCSCFEALQGRNTPCEFCPHEGTAKNSLSFEFYNPRLKHRFSCLDFALDSPENPRRKLKIAIDIPKATITPFVLKSLVRLLLSLSHDYFTNIEKILHFVLEQWKAEDVAYRGREGKLLVVSRKDQGEARNRETWANLFDASFQKRRWRLKRENDRILIFRVNQSALLGLRVKASGRSSVPKVLYLVVLRLLYLEEVRQQEALRWFRLFDRSPDLLFLVTEEGTIVRSNSKASEILGWDKRSFEHGNVGWVFGREVWEKLLERAHQTPYPTMELEIEDARGELRSFEARVSLFDAGEQRLYLLSLRDIGERKRYESVLLRFALYDQLTGLYNRRFLEEYLFKELERCRREGYPLSIALVDVDSFKRINDTYGHVFGDEVLKVVGETMQKMVRASDVVARYGGDEFVLVLPRADSHDVAKVMSRIAKNLRAAQIGSEPFPIRISYGTYAWDGRKNVKELFQEIDRRMYEMKRRGDGS